MDRSPAHLHLEIDLGSEPISGRLISPKGEGSRFNGWIELTEAIEHVRAPRAAAGCAAPAAAIHPPAEC